MEGGLHGDSGIKVSFDFRALAKQNVNNHLDEGTIHPFAYFPGCWMNHSIRGSDFDFDLGHLLGKNFNYIQRGQEGRSVYQVPTSLWFWAKVHFFLFTTHAKIDSFLWLFIFKNYLWFSCREILPLKCVRADWPWIFSSENCVVKSFFSQDSEKLNSFSFLFNEQNPSHNLIS